MFPLYRLNVCVIFFQKMSRFRRCNDKEGKQREGRKCSRSREREREEGEAKREERRRGRGEGGGGGRMGERERKEEWQICIGDKREGKIEGGGARSTTLFSICLLFLYFWSQSDWLPGLRGKLVLLTMTALGFLALRCSA